MKSLKWAATLGIVAICVILFLNRDDVMRYQKMRQMLCLIRLPIAATPARNEAEQALRRNSPPG
jgi:hypothetical protein